jgi:adenylate kinase
MEQQGVEIDWALDIEVEDATIIERMSGRRTCEACGASFHVVNNPPKTEGICDVCGKPLTIRKDDAPETVKARLETYHSQTEPLIAFYKQRNKLKTVDNQPTIEATTAEIYKALGI